MSWLKSQRGEPVAGVTTDSSEFEKDFSHAASNGEMLGTLNACAAAILQGRLDQAESSLINDVDSKTIPPQLISTADALHGEIKMRRGDWPAAAGAFEQALNASNGMDSFLRMTTGIAFSETGNQDKAQALLESAVADFNSAAANDSISAPRRAVLAEQARRAAMHLAVVKLRQIGTAADRDDKRKKILASLTDDINKGNGDQTWQGLLALMLAGERPISRVLASIPDSVPAARHVDMQVQALLAAARRMVLDGDTPGAVKKLESLPASVKGCDGLERALAESLLAKLKAGSNPGEI